MPSISFRNWFLTRISPPTSLLWVPIRESSSSTKTMAGLPSVADLRADPKSLATFCSASPSHFDMMEAASME